MLTLDDIVNSSTRTIKSKPRPPRVKQDDTGRFYVTRQVVAKDDKRKKFRVVKKKFVVRPPTGVKTVSGVQKYINSKPGAYQSVIINLGKIKSKPKLKYSPPKNPATNLVEQFAKAVEQYTNKQAIQPQPPTAENIRKKEKVMFEKKIEDVKKENERLLTELKNREVKETDEDYAHRIVNEYNEVRRKRADATIDRKEKARYEKEKAIEASKRETAARREERKYLDAKIKAKNAEAALAAAKANEIIDKEAEKYASITLEEKKKFLDEVKPLGPSKKPLSAAEKKERELRHSEEILKKAREAIENFPFHDVLPNTGDIEIDDENMYDPPADGSDYKYNGSDDEVSDVPSALGRGRKGSGERCVSNGRKYLTALYDDEINYYFADQPLFSGTIASDEIDKLPLQIPQGFIMNTAKRSDPEGEHWIAVNITPDSLEYYDSEALPPTKDFIIRIKKLINEISPNMLKFKINRVMDQKPGTNYCGYHAMRFLDDRFNGIPYELTTRFNKPIKDESTAGRNDIKKEFSII